MKLRYLWAYSAENQRVVDWHNRLIKERREKGFDVRGFCLTPDYLNDRKWLPFELLDRKWDFGDPNLIRMYREFLSALKECDVLIHYNGANIHPEIIKRIKQFKVFTCGDDPESTEHLSKPVAGFYDLHLVNNIACVEMYKEWGLKNVFFQPLGSIVFPNDVKMTKDEILDINRRSKQIVYIGEYNQYKKDIFDRIISEYPNSECWGRGWPKGYINDNDLNTLYKSSQIGFNVHNSSGPINFRLYDLPAYGIMQICDNKDYLNNIFELGTEAVGFNSANECIDLLDYYLSHPKEQREIALGGWDRWHRCYTPIGVFERMVKHIEENYEHFGDTNYGEIEVLLHSKEKKSSIIKFFNGIVGGKI